MSLLKLPDNQDSLSSYRPETFRNEGASPLNCLIKQQSMTPNMRRKKSVNTKNITPKRNLAISIANPNSPSVFSHKAKRKLFDPSTPNLEGSVRSKRPSLASTRFSDMSTKAGTIASLSKFSLKTLQSPQSLTSLHCENTSMQHNNAKGSLKSLHDFEAHSNRGETQLPKDYNSFLANSKDGTIETIGTRRGSFSSINNGLNFEKAVEAVISQRSNTMANIYAHERESKATVIETQETGRNESYSKRSTKRSERITQLKKTESLEREGGTESIVMEPKKKENGIEEPGLTGKKSFSRLLSEENLRTPAIMRNKSRSKDKKLAISSNTGLCIKTSGDILSPKHSMAYQPTQGLEELSNTVGMVTDTKKEEQQEEKVEYEKMGRRGMMMKQLQNRREKHQRNKSEGGTTLENEQVADINDKKNQNEEKESQRLKRPTLRRVTKESQGIKRGLNIEEGLINNDDVAMKNNETDKVLGEKLSVNQILAKDKDVKREVSLTESSRRKRLEEWMRLRRRENSSDEAETYKGTVKVVKDILRRNTCEEAIEFREDHKEFHLFKQEEYKYFEFNEENKYLQKYTPKKGDALNERPLTEKLDTLQSTQGNLPTEGTLKTSKSEKYLKTDPSTMIVRYYDEINPLVIQPKFMETTGSMCVTELWSNKSKQDFYKVMRKPFQSNTILSLTPSAGIYRPEKPVAPETFKSRRTRRDKSDNRENENSLAAKIERYGQNRSFLKSSSLLRHTRAFVLQGGTDSTPKKSARSFFQRD